VAAAGAAGVAVALSLVGAAAGAGVIAGVLVEGWSAALRGAATAKHSAAAIAVARAIETRPRSELSYIIGLNFHATGHQPIAVAGAGDVRCRPVFGLRGIAVYLAHSPARAEPRGRR